jgi:short-subunit dehydrogenase
MDLVAINRRVGQMRRSTGPSGLRRARLGVTRRRSKGSAVEALAPALALELAPVRVNAVTPGLIDTPLLHTAYGVERDAIVQYRAAVLPERRVGTADEVVQVILMLMTNDYVMDEAVHICALRRASTTISP